MRSASHANLRRIILEKQNWSAATERFPAVAVLRLFAHFTLNPGTGARIAPRSHLRHADATRLMERKPYISATKIPGTLASSNHGSRSMDHSLGGLAGSNQVGPR